MQYLPKFKIVLLLFAVVIDLQAQKTFEWAINAGGWGNDDGYGICLDRNNNVLVSGTVGHNASFGPYNIDTSDAFVAKYDTDGKILWVRSIRKAACFDVCADSIGNIYVAGSIDGTAWFGSDSIQSNGGDDIFLAKYDAQGNFIWARNQGHSDIYSEDKANGVAVDSEQNIYIVSKDASGFSLTKFDSTGNRIWKKEAFAYYNNSGNDVAIDKNDNIYVTGFTISFIAFDQDSLYTTNSYFVVKYDTSGQVIWAKADGLGAQPKGRAIATHPSGGCVVTGLNGDTTDNEIFVSRYNTNGQLLWSLGFGDQDRESAYGITTDSLGNIYISGTWGGDSTGGLLHKDIFITALDSMGKEIWNFKTGSPLDNPWYEEAGRAMVIKNQHLYITGTFKGTASFHPKIIHTSGSADIFIAKMLLYGSVGINNAPNPIGLSLYPNPASEKIVLEFKEIGEREIELITSSGQVVKSLKMDLIKEIIDIKNLPPGNYFLKVNEKGNSLMVPVVIK